MRLEMTDENVIDLLIFKIISEDGSVSYDEIKQVEHNLQQVGYSRSQFDKIVNHLNSMSTSAIQETIDLAIEKAKAYSDSHKADVISLIESFYNDKTVFDSHEKKAAEALITLISGKND